MAVAEPVVSHTNSKNRRSHNTGETINCVSKVLHVLEPRPDPTNSLTPVSRAPL